MKAATSLLTVFLIILFSSFSNSTTIIVDCTGGGDYLTIQEGINNSVDGDSVMVAPCVYYENNIDFDGRKITVMSTNPEDSAIVASTIVDGNSLGRVFHFFQGEDSTSVLAGFTISGGLEEYGGGIYCISNSSPTIKNNVISGNEATYGGGIRSDYSSPNILNPLC